jgi:hypothetical protein
VKEAEGRMEAAKSGSVLDAGLIACAQAVEYDVLERAGFTSSEVSVVNRYRDDATPCF